MATNQAYQAPSNTVARTPLGTSPGAFRISGISDPSRKRWLKMLVYGPHGAGKTTLLGSAVDVDILQDVLVVSAEGGNAVLEKNPRIGYSDLIDEVRIERIEQLQKIYEMLVAHCRYRDNGDDKSLEGLQRMTFGIPEGEELDRVRHYRTVIIDSLSEIEAQNLSKILGLDSLGLDAGDDMEVAGFPQFRKNNHIIQRIVRSLRDLPLHVFIVCAQGYSQDELKRYHYQPALTGKLSQQIQGFVDIVGWLVVGAPDPQDDSGAGPRRLFVQPQTGPKADAKNRFSSYGKSYFDNPTIRSIMEGIGFIKSE